MPHQNWCLLLLKFICWINWWVITRGSLQSEIRCPCISPNLLASEDTWHALRIRLPAISLYGEDSHASPISNSDFYSVLNLWVIESPQVANLPLSPFSGDTALRLVPPQCQRLERPQLGL